MTGDFFYLLHLFLLFAIIVKFSSRPVSLKSGFKKPGQHGMNVFRAVLITGPPGIGKTTSAHLCAKLEGFTPIEMNASDARSKKLVEVNSSPFLNGVIRRLTLSRMG